MRVGRLVAALVGGILVAGCAAGTAPPVPDGPVFGVPENLPTDCSVDVTAALNRWIRSVPDGTAERRSVLDLGRDRCYRVDGTLAVEGRRGLSFRGPDTRLDQSAVEGAPYRPAWLVRTSRWITFSGFHVVGAHETTQPSLGQPTTVSAYGFCSYDPSTSCEYQPGWAILGSSDVLLWRNTTSNTYGDSVLVMWDYPAGATESTDVVIAHHQVAGAGRQGIAVVSGRNIEIRDSEIAGVAQQPIDIEPEDARFPVRDVRITGNEFGRSYASIVLASGKCAEVRGVVFADNVETEPNITSQPSLYARNPCTSAYRGDFTIRSNVFWVDEYGDDGDTVARFEGDVRDVTFEGNSARFTCVAETTCTPDEPVVLADRMDGWRIVDNSFPSAATLWSLAGAGDRAGPVTCGNELAEDAHPASTAPC